MSNTPILAIPELTEGQATPETHVNEMVRYLEQGANYFIAKDKDTLTPPGSPADGDCYIIAGTGAGGWIGKDQKIAFRLSTGWVYITAREGTLAYLQDEDKFYLFDGSAWGAVQASASQVWTGTATNRNITPKSLLDAAAPVALTSGTTITPDFNAGFNFSLTLAHNATLANPTNQKPGQSGTIEITQDGTGSRTLAYGTNWKFPGGAPVLSTAAGAIDLLAYVVQASGRITATLTKAYSS